jgi:hypothetical protein
MGCNCRGSNSSYTPTNQRGNLKPPETICGRIAKEGLSLPLKVTTSGTILIADQILPAHSVISAQRCTGHFAERILTAELTVSSMFSNAQWKTEFFQRIGSNHTLGTVEALLQAMISP